MIELIILFLVLEFMWGTYELCKVHSRIDDDELLLFDLQSRIIELERRLANDDSK
jgi:hypothetical protein